MELRISNLRKTFSGDIRALDDLNLRVRPGLFGLLGPNGAGKSTLMRILATLMEADAGEVWLGDADLLAHPSRVRSMLGYLPQSFGAYPKMTAFEMLDYLAVMKGVGPRATRKARVERCLSTVNLYDVRHRRADQFSGGMIRRLGIAQAMLSNPKLLIVDEPTTGLDPLERQSLYKYLVEVSLDTIVLLATHLVGDVRSLCKDMAILGAGKILVQGPPEKIIAQYQGKIWSKSITPEALPELRRELDVIDTRWDHQRLYVDVRSPGAPRVGFHEKRVTLQDAYLAVSREGASRLGAGSLGFPVSGLGAFQGSSVER